MAKKKDEEETPSAFNSLSPRDAFPGSALSFLFSQQQEEHFQDLLLVVGEGEPDGIRNSWIGMNSGTVLPERLTQST